MLLFTEGKINGSHGCIVIENGLCYFYKYRILGIVNIQLFVFIVDIFLYEAFLSLNKSKKRNNIRVKQSVERE